MVVHTQYFWLSYISFPLSFGFDLSLPLFDFLSFDFESLPSLVFLSLDLPSFVLLSLDLLSLLLLSLASFSLDFLVLSLSPLLDLLPGLLLLSSFALSSAGFGLTLSSGRVSPGLTRLSARSPPRLGAGFLSVFFLESGPRMSRCLSPGEV